MRGCCLPCRLAQRGACSAWEENEQVLKQMRSTGFQEDKNSHDFPQHKAVEDLCSVVDYQKSPKSFVQTSFFFFPSASKAVGCGLVPYESSLSLEVSKAKAQPTWSKRLGSLNLQKPPHQHIWNCYEPAAAVPVFALELLKLSPSQHWLLGASKG